MLIKTCKKRIQSGQAVKKNVTKDLNILVVASRDNMVIILKTASNCKRHVHLALYEG